MQWFSEVEGIRYYGKDKETFVRTLEVNLVYSNLEPKEGEVAYINRPKDFCFIDRKEDRTCSYSSEIFRGHEYFEAVLQWGRRFSLDIDGEMENVRPIFDVFREISKIVKPGDKVEKLGVFAKYNDDFFGSAHVKINKTGVLQRMFYCGEITTKQICDLIKTRLIDTAELDYITDCAVRNNERFRKEMLRTLGVIRE